MIELGIAVLFVVALLIREYMFLREKKELILERSELLNRIKPETAQISNMQMPELVEPVRSDEEYWKAHEGQIKEAGTYPFGHEEEATGR